MTVYFGRYGSKQKLIGPVEMDNVPRKGDTVRVDDFNGEVVAVDFVVHTADKTLRAVVYIK